MNSPLLHGIEVKRGRNRDLVAGRLLEQPRTRVSIATIGKRLAGLVVLGIGAYFLTKASTAIILAIVGGAILLVAAASFVCIWSMNNTPHP